MDLDLAVCVDKPYMPTESSFIIYRMKYKRWERSNHLSMILIKAHIDKSIRDSVPKCNKVKDYIKATEEQFVSFDKALANTFMDKLSMMKHCKSKSVHEHIIEMRDIVAQLKSLEVDICESFIIHLILNTLPA